MPDDDDRIRIIGADEARAAMLRGESVPGSRSTSGAGASDEGWDDEDEDLDDDLEGGTGYDAYDEDVDEDVDEDDEAAGDWGGDEDWAPEDDADQLEAPAAPSGTVLGADAVLRARAEHAPDPDPSVVLPHWTEPPTGQLPSIFASDEDDDEEDLGVWSGVGTAAGDPWADEPSSEVVLPPLVPAEPEDPDDEQDPRALAARTRRLVRDADDVAGPHGDPLDDAIGAALGSEGPLATDEHGLARQLGKPRRRRVRGASPTMRLDTAPDHDDPDYLPPPPAPPPAPVEDLTLRLLTGGAVAVVSLGILHLFGRGPGSLLVGVIAALATMEIYAALRARGSRPATLLGIVASFAFPGMAYLRGEAAFPMVMGLFTLSVLTWYLVQTARHRPALNVAMSMLGFGYVGVLAAYGGLLLSFENGVGMLLGVVLCVVAGDIAAYVVGRHLGGARLSPTISPNKTVNGLIAGCLASVATGLIIVAQIHPWDTKSGFAIGILVAILAPVGDLVESMLKRDLGVKDFGVLLPGHGGVLDRFDAILFCLPAAYYLIRIGNVF